MVMAPDFNLPRALAEAKCSRCAAVGLVADEDGSAWDAAHDADRYRDNTFWSPSWGARCPACGLVGAWPGMSYPPDLDGPVMMLDWG
jgi:hypothetical protein